MNQTTPDQTQLQAFLADHDAACPSCRYNLRGLTSDRCPECNQAIMLGVQLVEPKLAAYVAGLVGLAAGAGFSGLLFIYFGMHWIFNGSGYIEPEFLWITGISGGVETSLMLAWIVWGRTLRRRASAQQWGLVIAAWVATAVNVAVFTSNIR